jgi:hypothetical protein
VPGERTQRETKSDIWDSLPQLTKDPGFNRVEITLPDKAGKPLALRLFEVLPLVLKRELKTLPPPEGGGKETVRGSQEVTPK